jgi:5-methylcytosine-specific restriction endonuclease McrA
VKHLHHIIPKHCGGTDNPENLVELTIEEHAEAHQKLYEQYGRIQDKRAWLGLAKIMSSEEIIKDILK